MRCEQSSGSRFWACPPLPDSFLPARTWPWCEPASASQTKAIPWDCGSQICFLDSFILKNGGPQRTFIYVGYISRYLSYLKFKVRTFKNSIYFKITMNPLHDNVNNFRQRIFLKISVKNMALFCIFVNLFQVLTIEDT